VPANPDNHWKYRMHLLLEDLLKEDEFNNELKGYIVHSGR
jgi:4-alpha-glucanotransferase